MCCLLRNSGIYPLSAAVTSEAHEVCSVPDRNRYCILSVVRVECGFDGGFDLEAGSVEYLIPALRRAAVMSSPLRDRQRRSQFFPVPVWRGKDFFIAREL